MSYPENNYDAILPEGFNPELGDQNFDANGELVEAAPAEESTTTTEATAETPEQQTETTQETTESTEPTTVTEPAKEEVPTEPVAPQTVKVRYNHEDRELSLDEAALYAQKGMNYDRLESKVKEQGDKLTQIEDLARMLGYDNADVMMQQAEQNYVDIKVKDLVDQGNTDAMARFLVQQELAKAKQTIKAAQPETPAPTAKPTGLSPERKAELDEFSKAYPDVIKIPDEVFKLHSEGVRLKTAYEIYQGKQALEAEKAKVKAAQDELAILRQNQASAAQGPVTGTVGKAEPTKTQADDPFLMGFDKDYY